MIERNLGEQPFFARTDPDGLSADSIKALSQVDENGILVQVLF